MGHVHFFLVWIWVVRIIPFFYYSCRIDEDRRIGGKANFFLVSSEGSELLFCSDRDYWKQF